MKVLKYGLFALLSLMAMPALAAVNISVEGLVELVIYLIIIGAVFWLLIWLIDYVGLPAPFNRVARVVVMVVGVLILINLLLTFAGHPVFTMH